MTKLDLREARDIMRQLNDAEIYYALALWQRSHTRLPSYNNDNRYINIITRKTRVSNRAMRRLEEMKQLNTIYDSLLYSFCFVVFTTAFL